MAVGGGLFCTEEENGDRKWRCLSSQFEGEKCLLFDKRKVVYVEETDS